MKYLKKFATEADVMMSIKPNVVLIKDSGKVLYNVMPNDVFIQHIDGTLYTEDKWTAGGFTRTEANGVAVLDERASFVMSRGLLSDAIQWTTDTPTLIEGVLASSDVNVAKTDYAGFSNTQIIASDTTSAAYACSSYTFPNGQKGYLPSLGEILVSYDYKTKITSLFNKYFGWTIQTYVTLWSSTQVDADKVWGVNWKYDGSISKWEKTYNGLDLWAFGTL